MVNAGLFTSSTDEWATPKDFYKQLNQEFHFTLDPCATDENHKCEKYYTIADDGLRKPWGGIGFSAIRHTEDKLRSGYARRMKPILNMGIW